MDTQIICLEFLKSLVKNEVLITAPCMAMHGTHHVLLSTPHAFHTPPYPYLISLTMHPISIKSIAPCPCLILSHMHGSLHYPSNHPSQSLYSWRMHGHPSRPANQSSYPHAHHHSHAWPRSIHFSLYTTLYTYFYLFHTFQTHMSRQSSSCLMSRDRPTI